MDRGRATRGGTTRSSRRPRTRRRGRCAGGGRPRAPVDPDLDPGLARQVAVGRDPEPSTTRSARALAVGEQTAPGSNRDRRRQADVDAQAAEGVRSVLGHVGVEGRHQLVGGLDQRDLERPTARTPRPSRGRCSRRRPPRPGRGTRDVRRGPERPASSSVCTPARAARPIPGRSGRRAATRWRRERVEPDRDPRCRRVVPHLDRPGVEVDGRRPRGARRTSMRCWSRNSPASGPPGRRARHRHPTR